MNGESQPAQIKLYLTIATYDYLDSQIADTFGRINRLQKGFVFINDKILCGSTFHVFEVIRIIEA